MVNLIRRLQVHRAAAARFSTLLVVTASILLVAPRSAAQVTASPGMKIFGTAGASAVITIAVPAGTTLGSFSVLTMGAPNLDFTSVPAGTTCPDVVAGTCKVEVQFAPTTTGRRHGALVLSDPAGHALLSVSLVGTGSRALLAFGPGVISTFAGSGTGGDGGAASDARLVGPTGITVDGFGNHYIADQGGNTIRKVTPAGIISTFAGTGVPGYSGDGGPASSARLSGPMSVLVDGAGFVYVADTGNNVVRMVDAAGLISTYAGQYYAPGTAPPPVCAAATNAVGDGCPGNQMVLNMPVDLVFCIAQNLHIADKLNHRVRTIFRTTYRTITQVGNGTAGYSGDGGLNTSAQLDGPTGMAMDAANFIYVADSGNHVVRKTLLTGTTPNPISTVAGTPGSAGNLGDGSPAVEARLASPHGVQVDPAGNIYISDLDSRVVRKVDAATGLISTIAGTTAAGSGGDGGPASSAPLNAPSGILLDDLGNLYVADAQGAAIRKVDVSSAPSLAFAATPVGAASAPQLVTVLNLGNSPATLGGISAPANYSLGGPGTSCRLSGGQTLDPATSCSLGIAFTPTAGGNLDGSLVLTDVSTAATYTIALSGTVQAPEPPASGGGCGSGPAGPWSMALLGVALLVTRRSRRR
jgi:MYXO-CTERM domain-containing protein